MKLFVLFAAISQVIAAALLSIGTFEDSEKVFTVFIQPAGWAFSIWGLIYTLSLVYAVYQLLPANENALVSQTRLPAALGFIGSIVWLFFAGTDNWLIWITIPILTLMAFIFTIVIRTDAVVSGRQRIFSQTILYPYAAWTAVAFWLNVQSVMAEEGLITSPDINVATNLVLFVGLVLFTGYYLYRTGWSLWYGGVLVWAATGVVIANLSESGNVLFAILAGLYGGGVALSLIIGVIRKRSVG